MMSNEYIMKIESKVQEYWDTSVVDELKGLLIGKELGHRIADFVDDKTTAFLRAYFKTALEYSRTGNVKARSMGDIWMEENDIYHPVNVKAGIVGSEGQPNMVSLNKLLMYLVTNSIDSYYLLLVKINIGSEGSKLSVKVTMVDMLNIMDYLTFDAGPGQIMLKKKKFMADAEKINKRKTQISLEKKVHTLVALLKDGEARLKTNREKRLIKTLNNLQKYLQRENYSVVPGAQKALQLY